MAELIELSGDELAEALCRELEPYPPRVTARQARASVPHFVWVSCYTYFSPLGWWEAEIGTDHGPTEDDDKPVRWRPAPELADGIEAAWRVVEEMKSRGWLMHVMAMTDGWVVNAREQLPGNGFVQEVGDEAAEAICRAALAALRLGKEGRRDGNDS